MPPIHDLDPYDKCLKYSVEPGTYCMVYAEIIPNKSSNIWEIVKNFSDDQKHRFRHDHLFFGICIQECLRLLANDTTFHGIAIEDNIMEDVEVTIA